MHVMCITHCRAEVQQALKNSSIQFPAEAVQPLLLLAAAHLARACVPRSVTVALALPISAQLDAPAAITAAVVLTQDCAPFAHYVPAHAFGGGVTYQPMPKKGMLGANFGPSLMSALGYKDTIARGLAAAATAGGLGTASLTSKEPEALPFCALSYSMVRALTLPLALCKVL
eukprot:scaffold8629_cov18-Tisochrysis_lutea.AAC.2